MNDTQLDATPWWHGLTHQEMVEKFTADADKLTIPWEERRGYYKLAATLLGREPECNPFPDPTISLETGKTIEPRLFVGDLTAEDDRRLCSLVDLFLDEWDRLSELERLPFMEKAIRAQQLAETKESKTAINNSQESEPTKSNRIALLEVEIDSRRAKLITAKGEKSLDLPSEGVARWLKVLAEHPNEWFRPGDYQAHDPELDGVKPSDRRRSLEKSCSKLAELIEASKHDGMRFIPRKTS